MTIGVKQRHIQNRQSRDIGNIRQKTQNKEDNKQAKPHNTEH